MPLWKVASIEDQPSVKLYDWKIMKMQEGSYFAGNEGVGAGRVSTEIVEYDPDKKIGRTKSGRVYQLLGDESPNLSRDASYVWDRYKQINNLTDL
jgi:hypothetical protein